MSAGERTIRVTVSSDQLRTMCEKFFDVVLALEKAGLSRCQILGGFEFALGHLLGQSGVVVDFDKSIDQFPAISHGYRTAELELAMKERSEIGVRPS